MDDKIIGAFGLIYLLGTRQQEPENVCATSGDNFARNNPSMHDLIRSFKNINKDLKINFQDIYVF